MVNPNALEGLRTSEITDDDLATANTELSDYLRRFFSNSDDDLGDGRHFDRRKARDGLKYRIKHKDPDQGVTSYTVGSLVYEPPKQGAPLYYSDLMVALRYTPGAERVRLHCLLLTELFDGPVVNGNAARLTRSTQIVVPTDSIGGVLGGDFPYKLDLVREKDTL